MNDTKDLEDKEIVDQREYVKSKNSAVRGYYNHQSFKNGYGQPTNNNKYGPVYQQKLHDLYYKCIGPGAEDQQDIYITSEGDVVLMSYQLVSKTLYWDSVKQKLTYYSKSKNQDKNMKFPFAALQANCDNGGEQDVLSIINNMSLEQNSIFVAFKKHLNALFYSSVLNPDISQRQDIIILEDQIILLSYQLVCKTLKWNEKRQRFVRATSKKHRNTSSSVEQGIEEEYDEDTELLVD
ncbi:MAG: hypothetical protein P857_127 [Candidatus Xenolissoclinum pacificiensis L6]|uniref:Uncharacterized protein n=1 Tax=Candidatus Xenolissoclinum pacificiensis L6 TaxID=1401685 RepID=W2V073_9RICK|nr:MAG: hypothetical protein P857_127 [Candidatus Xenolissoclinum pacificiensis L6]